jgi:hypothetical protein
MVRIFGRLLISLLKLHSYMSRGFDAGGKWSIAFG